MSKKRRRYIMEGYNRKSNEPQFDELEDRTKQLLGAAFKSGPLRQLPRGINAKIGEYLDDWTTEMVQKNTVDYDHYYTYHPLIGGFLSYKVGQPIRPYDSKAKWGGARLKGYKSLYPDDVISKNYEGKYTDFNKVTMGISDRIRGSYPDLPPAYNMIHFNPYFKLEEQRDLDTPRDLGFPAVTRRAILKDEQETDEVMNKER